MISADNETGKGVVTLNRALVDGEKVEVTVGETVIDAVKIVVDEKDATKYNYTFTTVAATDEKQTITVTAKAGESEKTAKFEVEAKEYTVTVDGNAKDDVTVAPLKGKKGTKVTVSVKDGKKVKVTVGTEETVLDATATPAEGSKKELELTIGSEELKIAVVTEA